MKYTLYMTLAFFLMGCVPDSQVHFLKADPVPEIVVSNPSWKELKYEEVTYLGLDVDQFRILMSDLNKIADRMERMDKTIEFYERMIDEANR